MSILKNEAYYLDKLFVRWPEEFRQLYLQGEYARAAYVERKAFHVAMFLELPQELQSELFGCWPDDGDDGTAAPPGLFNRDWVRDADWRCCIRQHKTYQDEACRRLGIPLRYYSDDDYCALHCRHAGRGTRERVERMRAAGEVRRAE